MKKESVSNSMNALFSKPSTTSETDFQKLMFVEEILELMEEKGINRMDMASKLSVQPSRITSILSGTNNFTLETMIRLADAVDAKFHLSLIPRGKNFRCCIWEAPAVDTGFRVVKQDLEQAKQRFSTVQTQKDRTVLDDDVESERDIEDAA